ncbi:MAG TPA: FMN reductase [Pseudonocardiaceae bacterium]|nr:FMN reductase [Pseudonocardiaceae bacterium]
MSALRLVVVSAGLSQPSSTRLLADRLTRAVRTRLVEDGRTADLTVIELRDLAVDIANDMVTGFASPVLAEAIDEVAHADGLIVVTPIFTASYSGLFKSFFDVLDNDLLAGKPVLVAATGGTARHSLALEHALRPMFAYLRAVVVPTAVYAAAEDWGGAGDAHTSPLATRITRAGDELAMLMTGARATPAEPEAPADEFDRVTPFAEQLAALRALPPRSA